MTARTSFSPPAYGAIIGRRGAGRDARAGLVERIGLPVIEGVHRAHVQHAPRARGQRRLGGVARAHHVGLVHQPAHLADDRDLCRQVNDQLRAVERPPQRRWIADVAGDALHLEPAQRLRIVLRREQHGAHAIATCQQCTYKICTDVPGRPRDYDEPHTPLIIEF
jgi:hypothetical protein